MLDLHALASLEDEEIDQHIERYSINDNKLRTLSDSHGIDDDDEDEKEMSPDETTPLISGQIIKSPFVFFFEISFVSGFVFCPSFLGVYISLRCSKINTHSDS